jgi:hypothetical protein
MEALAGVLEEIAMYSNEIAESPLLKPSIGVRSYFSKSV